MALLYKRPCFCFPGFFWHVVRLFQAFFKPNRGCSGHAERPSFDWVVDLFLPSNSSVRVLESLYKTLSKKSQNHHLGVLVDSI